MRGLRHKSRHKVTEAYVFFAFLGHRALAAFCARLDRSAAVIPFAALAPPCCPRHTGQYSTTTSRVSG